MLLKDTFQFSSFTEGMKNAIEGIELLKITMDKSCENVTLWCKSREFIHPHYISELQTYIEDTYFAPEGRNARIRISFDCLSTDDVEEIWYKYREYATFILANRNQIIPYVLMHSKISFNEDTMIICMRDDIFSRKIEETLPREINKIFTEWFGFSIDIKCTYYEEEKRPKREEEVAPLRSTVVDYDYAPDYDLPPLPDPDEYTDYIADMDTEEAMNAEYDYTAHEDAASADKTDAGKGDDAGADVNGENAGKDKDDKDKGKEFRKKKLPPDPNLFFGKNFDGDITPIKSVDDGMFGIVISGMIISVEEKPIRGERTVVEFDVTDFEDTVSAKVFVADEQLDEFKKDVSEGKFITLKGNCLYDSFSRKVCFSGIIGIKRSSDHRVARTDEADVKRVELHAHTQMSDMDAVNNVVEYIRQAVRWGHPAVAITDHGVVQAFTDAYHALCDPGKTFKKEPEMAERLRNFKIIYGCEGYLVNDDDLVDENGTPLMDEAAYWEAIKAKANKRGNQREIYHIIYLVKNDIGRTNLYKLVSLGHLKYFHRRPLTPKSVLKANREGIIIGSACESGELFRAILNEYPKEKVEEIAELYDYYEIQPTGNNAFLKRDNDYPNIVSDRDLEAINRRIIDLADEHHKLCIATCDVHFLNPEDEIYRAMIMASKGFDDADLQPPLYFRTTDEMLREFSYLPKEKAYEVVVENTRKIADMIEKIAPVRPDKCPPVIENSDNELRKMCYEKATSMYGDPLPEIVQTRLDKELKSIIGNGYSVMYIIAQRLVKKSNDDGYLVGSRGSVGSSFAATMSDITEVNPLPPHYYCKSCKYSEFDSPEIRFAIDNTLSGYDLPKKTCPNCGAELTRDGQNIPFETFLGFKGDKEPDIDLNFSGEYQAKAHAYTEVLFGTGHTFKAGTIGTLAEKTAYGIIKKYFEERGITKREAEINRLVKGCTGVRRTTGQHPGGIVVLPHGEEIYSFTPVQHPANDVNSDIVTTHFDYHSIDHNLLKLDILGHDDPTMIRFLEDVTGENAKDWPMDDQKVYSLFTSCEALGVTPEQIGTDLGSLGLPELGTNFAMNMLRDAKPGNFSDMIRISGLSHGTDVWAGNAQELIKSGKCTLQTAICTRDDIMTFLILKGVEPSTAFKIMESVRKGRGLKPEMEETMVANGIPDWYIWSCKKIKYMFPKAHACAYIMMAIRIAYCKVYKPLAYYAAYFSIRATSFDYEMMAQGKEKLIEEMDKLKKKIDKHENSPKDKDLYDDAICVREMYARGFEFLPIDIYEAKANRFIIKDGKLMPSFSTLNGMGDIAARQAEEAARNGSYSSINDFKSRTKTPSSVIEIMKRCGLFGNLPEDDQLSLEDLFK